MPWTFAAFIFDEIPLQEGSAARKLRDINRVSFWIKSNQKVKALKVRGGRLTFTISQLDVLSPESLPSTLSPNLPKA